MGRLNREPSPGCHIRSSDVYLCRGSSSLFLTRGPTWRSNQSNAQVHENKPNPYRSPVPLLPPHGAELRVPQSNLTSLQVRRRAVQSFTSALVLVEVVTVSTRPSSASSVRSFSASISVSSTSSSASSPSSTAISRTHSAVGNKRPRRRMLKTFR